MKKKQKLAIHAASERLCTSLLKKCDLQGPPYKDLSPPKANIQINLDNKNGQGKQKPI